MKNAVFKNLFFALILVLTFTGVLHADAVVQASSELDPNVLVSSLNAVIVFLAVQLAKKVKDIAPVWLLGMAIPLLNALSAWLLTLVVPDTSWGVSFAVGFGATFIQQLKVYLAEGKKKPNKY